MTTQDILELAARVEAATGPDRDIDREIAPLVGLRIVDEGQPIGRVCYDQNNHGVPLPSFTASLDAAMTLLPEGMGYVITPGKVALIPDHGPDFRVDASTDALALTAAALKARAHTKGDHSA